MPRFSRLIAFLLILLLAGCSPPGGTQQPATDPDALPPPASETLDLTPENTDTPAPTLTLPPLTQEPETAAPDPTPSKPRPTLGGDPIPLLPAGSEINITEIHMLGAQSGWALTRDSQGIDHVLFTTNGGSAWKDITPPQPLTSSPGQLQASALFSDPRRGWVAYSGSDLVWTTGDGGRTWDPSQLEYQTQGGSLLVSFDPGQVWLFQFLDAGMQKVYTAVYSSQSGGRGWNKLLDPYTDSSIQGFDKTGAFFVSPDFGWLTRDFRGVAVYVYLDITRDGGQTWENLDMPAPPSAPEAFSSCACGLYDPFLNSPQEGAVRLSCSCYENEENFVKNYLYRTQDGGASWEITYIPRGKLYHPGGQTYYAVGRDIYRSTDGGVEWDLMKSVSWEGQFSFIDADNALAAAYDPVDGEYALVRTRNGCRTFEIITPELLSTISIR